jgi:CRP/FNR family cyclic AMP-dependent transcriptional regulator
MAKKDIHKSPLFEGIDQKHIDEFLNELPELIHLKAGEYLWRQGDSGSCMYLLYSGKLEVILEASGEDKEAHVIATFTDGAVIGEVCLLGERYRSASIRAVNDVELWMIDDQKFHEKVNAKDPVVLTMCYNIAKLLTHRLIAANHFIGKLQKISNKEIKSEIETYRKRFFEESLFG